MDAIHIHQSLCTTHVLQSRFFLKKRYIEKAQCKKFGQQLFHWRVQCGAIWRLLSFEEENGCGIAKGVLVEHTSFPFAFCPPDWINWRLASINPPCLHLCSARTHVAVAAQWDRCWHTATTGLLGHSVEEIAKFTLKPSLFRLSLSLSPLARFVRLPSLSLSVEKKPSVCSKVRVTSDEYHLWVFMHE